MWVVTPPFQTAPQRMIGAGYNFTANDSVQMPRVLRFVLNDHDYALAMLLHDFQGSTRKLTAFRALGKGLLFLEFTGHQTGRDGALEWIEFRGRACVPR